VSQLKKLIRGLSVILFAIVAISCVSGSPSDKPLDVVSAPPAAQQVTVSTTKVTETENGQRGRKLEAGTGSVRKVSNGTITESPVNKLPVTAATEVSEPKPLAKPANTASESPRSDGLHDKNNDAIAVLQSPTEAMVDFPRDRRMEVDWVKTLDQGHIEPRANITGEDAMETMDMDILMKNTQDMPWVKFPHFAHTKWLACSNCHPAIFLPQQGANPITMNKVLRGEYCGVCHDKVAFSLFVCERCHSVSHEGSGPKWW